CDMRSRGYSRFWRMTVRRVVRLFGGIGYGDLDTVCVDRHGVAGQAGAAEFADRIGGCLARLLAIEHLTVRERGCAYSDDNPHEKPFRHCRYPFSVHSRLAQ